MDYLQFDGLRLPFRADPHSRAKPLGNRAHRRGLCGAAAQGDIPLRESRRPEGICRLFHPIQPERLARPRCLCPRGKGAAAAGSRAGSRRAARHGACEAAPSQIRFTDPNTYPFLEAYYAASAMGVEDAADKGDALLREYARTLIEYIEYYLRFDGVQGDMVSPIIDEKLEPAGRRLLPCRICRAQGSHRRDQRLLPFARSRRGEPRGCGRQAPPGRYDPYPAQRHSAIVPTGDKRRKPLLCGGAFHILRVGTSGREQPLPSRSRHPP